MPLQNRRECPWPLSPGNRQIPSLCLMSAFSFTKKCNTQYPPLAILKGLHSLGHMILSHHPVKPVRVHIAYEPKTHLYMFKHRKECKNFETLSSEYIQVYPKISAMHSDCERHCIPPNQVPCLPSSTMTTLSLQKGVAFPKFFFGTTYRRFNDV